MTDDARNELRVIATRLDNIDDNGLAARVRASGFACDDEDLDQFGLLWPAFTSEEIRDILMAEGVGAASDSKGGRIYRVFDVDAALRAVVRPERLPPSPATEECLTMDNLRDHARDICEQLDYVNDNLVAVADGLLADVLRRGGYCREEDMILLWPTFPHFLFEEIIAPCLTIVRRPGDTRPPLRLFRISDIDGILARLFSGMFVPEPVVAPPHPEGGSL